MNTKLILFTSSLLLLNLACDEKKKDITQELCESQTNRADCEAAGCTYTCGMVLVETISNISNHNCAKRRNVGRCLAVVKLIPEESNNQDYFYSISSGNTGWLSDVVSITNVNNTATSYSEYFKIENPHPYPLEVLGHHSYVSYFGTAADPCSQGDPDGTLFPWEGSCETDWWSEDIWDDVLPE